MLRELKYLMFISLIILFIFFVIKFYFSDLNKKKSYRSLNKIDKKILLYSNTLPILNNDTKDIVKYITKTNNRKKKKYKFWKLLSSNE
tara:strand:+ start:142 stop:405 length:264 start_codon:yes stop_codon:yes gene_type:complete